MSKWELSCLVFNSLVYKIFTPFSENFGMYGGSAAWLTALFSGIVFLLVLWLILKLYTRYADDGLLSALRNNCNGFVCSLVSAAAILYFAVSACYSTYLVCDTLKTVVFVKSPFWFLILFFAAGAVITALCGEKAVRRLHSLNVFGIGAALVIIALLSLKYADIFNIMPILGNGVSSVFGKGLATLFLYSDIIIIFFMPKQGADYSFKRTVMHSAISAVIVNTAVVIAMNLNMPVELSEKLSLPIYPLTKTANIGKLPLRLDAIYMIALITSSLLYITLALHLVIKNIKTFSKKFRHAASSAVCIVLCATTLCGCFDKSEVEDNAFIIALGIDRGENEKFKYTFQLSNPLESGGSIGAEQKATENSSEQDEANKTVDNVIIEASDYYTALDKLKSYIGKKPDLSHIKVIAYSFATAKKDSLKHSELLLNEREIRPGTNVCLAESANKFLLSVKPTLEESTVRYYELFFKSYDNPYSPVTELRDFVGRSVDSGYDAILPIVDDNGLSGMGIFSDGILKDQLSGNEVLIYKMLCGELKRTSLYIDDTSNIIQSDGFPDIAVDISDEMPIVTINLRIKCDEANTPELDAMLKERAEQLLYKASEKGCDIFGLGRYVKKECQSQEEWENTNWKSLLPNAKFFVNILTNNVKNRQNLQKT